MCQADVNPPQFRSIVWVRQECVLRNVRVAAGHADADIHVTHGVVADGNMVCTTSLGVEELCFTAVMLAVQPS